MKQIGKAGVYLCEEWRTEWIVFIDSCKHIYISSGLRDAWVAQRFSICLRPQSMILGSRDHVLHRAPCREPASPSAYVPASLMNK